VPRLQRALVFANGDLNPGPAVRSALRHSPEALIIAADGGAHMAETLGVQPDVIVGDMDSLSEKDLERLAARGSTVERSSTHKDETDLELALLAAARRGATWIRVIGAMGDRLDQTLANLYLLLLPELAERDARLVAGRQTLWLIGPGTHTVNGKPGDTISLLPLGGDAVGVRTEALVYPLCDETLVVGPARGVSNVMQAGVARVTLRAGTLMVIHTPGRA
jgi:thiamine pyrophosphokinase